MQDTFPKWKKADREGQPSDSLDNTGLSEIGFVGKIEPYASALASSAIGAASSATASFFTTAFTVTVTSRCSFTGTLNSPTVFSGTSRSILRRSMVKPLASSACAMSDDVTEPNN